jgi:hypothetical protein
MAMPQRASPPGGAVFVFDAGWSSPVARQAHNLKVVGSNPTPATKEINDLALVPGLQKKILRTFRALLVRSEKNLKAVFGVAIT